MPTKSQLEQAVARLRKEKGGIKADRTTIKAQLVRVEKRLANSQKRTRILRLENTELLKELRAIKRQRRKFERQLEKANLYNSELHVDLNQCEKRFKDMQKHARNFMQKHEALELKIREQTGS